MEAHPLRGAVRWLIYPLLAIGAGCLPGLLLDLHQKTRPFTNTFLGGALGGAVALGVALSSRWWVGLLVATVLGSLSFVWCRYVIHCAGWDWAYILSGVLNLRKEPGPIGGSLLLTAPLVLLHWIRLRRADAWPIGWLFYAAPILLLTLLSFLAGAGQDNWMSVAFLLLLNLGSRAAWEGALKASGAQLGSPSGRVASS
jgi:hypothetical protein